MYPHIARGHQALWLSSVALTLLLACTDLALAQSRKNEISLPLAGKQKHQLEKTSARPDVTENGATPLLKKTVDLVLIPVTVADSDNRLVKGLEKNDFQLFERGTRQSITHFFAEDQPISLGV